MSRKQGSGGQEPPDDAARAYLVRLYAEKSEQAWEMHVRGENITAIAAKVELDRDTVRRLLQEHYRQISSDRKAESRRKLDLAVARLRRIQAQAWTDHDEDDAREQHVLRTFSAQDEDEDEGKKPRRRAESGGVARFQSQRAAYLRVILDAEREVARLEGLYDGVGDAQGAILVRIERVGGATTVLGQPEVVADDAEVA